MNDPKRSQSAPAQGAQFATIAGEPVIFLPHRAVYWPRTATLLIADLHIGKAESLRANGSPMPDGILRADLARLTDALTLTGEWGGARRLLILGDLLHATTGVTPALIDEFAAWRYEVARSIELLIIPGNHDLGLHIVEHAWGVNIANPLHIESPFAFTHNPAPVPDHFIWSGHLHPCIHLASRRDALRLPCFWLTPAGGVLPAFSAFTGGMAINRSPGDRVLAIAEGRVVEV